MVQLQETGELMEDKLFFVVHGTDTKGTLQESFEGGRNQWMSFNEAFAQEKTFDSFKIELDLLTSSEWLVERTTTYSKEHF